MIVTSEALAARLQQELPGEAAHLLMYPRKGAAPQYPSAEDNVRLSAVAIVLFEKENALHTLVIQRSVYEGSHSGQIAFPGGKWEQGDASLKETALRECREEVGIVAEELEYLGKLTDVYTAVSSFLIEPYIFYWSQPDNALTLSEREVAAVHRISLEAIIDDAIIQRIDVPIQGGVILKNVPHFVLGNVKIWGATALMLSELKWILRSM